MPRYFFHVHDGAFTPDEDGTDLHDLAAARVAAAELAGSILKEGAGAFWDGGEWKVCVNDEQGALLFALGFIVEAPGGGAPWAGAWPNRLATSAPPVGSANDPGE